jgi:rod shape-determining protein MreB and related proteins
MGLFDFLKETLGIDPGSRFLRIIRNEKLVFNEHSQISIDKGEHTVSGSGDSIRTTTEDVVVQPVSCVPTDFQAFEMLLRGAIKKALPSNSILGLPKSYRLYYSIPTSSTEIDKRAYRDAAEHVGAVEVYMVHQCICSAVGMNILFETKDFIVIDFSSSKIDIVVFANSLIISEGVVRMGTRQISKLLRNHLRRKHKIELNEGESEDVLKGLSHGRTGEVKIQHATLNVEEIQALLDNFFSLVNDEFMEAIEQVSDHPDIEKVIRNGVYFTGGGSTIGVLRDQIQSDDRIKRTLSSDPMFDTINGLKRIMAEREKFSNYIMV